MAAEKHMLRTWCGALLLSAVLPMAIAGPQEDAEQAEKEFARGNLILAMSMWRKAAGQGYAPAQARLGDILDKSEEDEEAVSWYRKAAAQNNPAGEYGLGQMYSKGEGVKQDFAQARSYIERAAQNNYLPAVILMMEMHKNGGMGAARDPAQAAKWETKVKELSPKEAGKELAKEAVKSK